MGLNATLVTRHAPAAPIMSVGVPVANSTKTTNALVAQQGARLAQL